MTANTDGVVQHHINSTESMLTSFRALHKFFSEEKDFEKESVDKITDLCDNIDHMVEFAKEHANYFMNTIGSVLPGFLFLSKKGGVCPMIMQTMPEGYERALIFSGIAALLNTSPVDGYFFMSEVWVANVSDDSEIAKLSPSQRSDKKEGIFIRVANRNESKIVFLNVDRADDGSVSLTEQNLGLEYKVSNVLMDNIYALSKEITETIYETSTRH